MKTAPLYKYNQNSTKEEFIDFWKINFPIKSTRLDKTLKNIAKIMTVIGIALAIYTFIIDDRTSFLLFCLIVVLSLLTLQARKISVWLLYNAFYLFAGKKLDGTYVFYKDRFEKVGKKKSAIISIVSIEETPTALFIRDTKNYVALNITTKNSNILSLLDFIKETYPEKYTYKEN